jgi:pyroglutamyl-peptidase
MSRPDGDEAVLLVTGFGPFAGYPDNPSGQIALAADGMRVGRVRVVGRTLDVVWRAAWPALAAAVDEVSPVGLMCLGVCPDSFFRLELMARNLAPPSADVFREYPPSDERMRIAPDGPPAYWTGLPVEWLAERMEARRVRLAGSPHDPDAPYARAIVWPDAGLYLCNHVFFHAMHDLAGRVPHRGFVHVPRPADGSGGGLPSRDEVIDAGTYLVGEFARWLGER